MQSEYGPPRGSVYSFAPGVQVWSQGVLLIDGKRGNAPGNFPSPGGAPSMALRPDGAILLAKKEHPGSVGSVYEFGSGARSGADGRQVRLTPLAAKLGQERDTFRERHHVACEILVNI